MGKNVPFSGVFSLALLVAALWHAPAFASINATETVTGAQIGPNSYEYSITLKNTGTTNIGTLWFAWTPFYDLLPTAPTSIISPPGWSGQNAPDFYGVASAQWVNTTTPLAPGQSLSGFKFDTTDPPSVIGGTSFYAGLPVTYSYVYIGQPQTDPGFPLSAPVSTPEPGAVALLLAGSAGVFIRRKRR